MNKQLEIKLSGGFGETEEAILAYLYAHPTDAVPTRTIAKDLHAERYISERNKVCEEIQEGIGTLILAKLVKGKRVSDSEMVYHTKLSLTPRGEAEAIKQQRMVKKIILDIPRPQRESSPEKK